MSCLDTDFHHRCLDRLLLPTCWDTEPVYISHLHSLLFHCTHHTGSPQPTLTSVGHSTIRHTHLQATLRAISRTSFLLLILCHHAIIPLIFLYIIIPFAADWWTHFFLHPLFAREKNCEKDKWKRKMKNFGSYRFRTTWIYPVSRIPAKRRIQYLGFTMTTLSYMYFYDYKMQLFDHSEDNFGKRTDKKMKKVWHGIGMI